MAKYVGCWAVALLAWSVALSMGVGQRAARAQELHPRVLFQGEDSVLVEVEFPAVRFDTVDREAGLVVPRMQWGVSPLQRGVPDLPRFALSYPVRGEGLRIHVVDVEAERYDGVHVAPAYGSRPRGGDSVWQRVPGEAYGASQWWPLADASLGESYMLHAQREQSVLLYPVRYHPVQRSLQVTRRLRLAIAGLSLPVGRGRSGAQPQRGEGHYGMPAALQYRGAGGELLLIVSPQKYHEALQPLIEWKRLSGYQVELHPFGPGSPLHDTVSLASYVRERYAQDGRLRYLLLVGGRADIPPLRRAGANRKGDSDQAYGQLVGNDGHSEVYVGRFSARDAKQVSVQVARTIRYERDLNRSDAWLGRVLAIASNENFTGDNGETDREHARGILKQCLKGTYAQSDSVFEGYPTATRSELVRLLNYGTGFVNYTGHGYPMRWKSFDFRVADVFSLTNARATPFIFDVACSNGEMDSADPCFAEAWLWATHANQPSGAVAMAAASTMLPWDEPMRAQDLFASYASGIYSHDMATYGALFARALSGMLNVYSDPQSLVQARKTVDVWNIFGDPSLRLRTSVPLPVEVQFSNYIEAGTAGYRMAVNRDGACVVMRIAPADGAAPRYIRTEARGGYADFPSVSLLPGDRVVLAVTGHNLESFVSPEIEVQPSQAVQLAFQDVRLLASASTPVEVVSPEQQLELAGALGYLAGPLPLSEVVVRYSVDPPGAAEFLSGAEEVLAPFGEHGVVADAVRKSLIVSATHTDASRFTIGLEALVKGQTKAQLSIPVLVSAPGLVIDSMQVLADDDDDGIIAPGERFSVGVWLTNTGVTTLSGGAIHLRLRAGEAIEESQTGLDDIPAKRTVRMVLHQRIPGKGVDANSICTLSTFATWGPNRTDELACVVPVGRAFRGLQGEVEGYPFAEANARQVVSFLLPPQLLPARGEHLAAVRVPVRSQAGEGEVLGRAHAALRVVEGNDWNSIDRDEAFSVGPLRSVRVVGGWAEIPLLSTYYEPGARFSLTIVSEALPQQAPYAVQTFAAPSSALVGLTERAGGAVVEFQTNRLPRVAFRAAQLVDYTLVVRRPQEGGDDQYSLRIGDRVWRLSYATPFVSQVLEGVQTIQIQSEIYRDTVFERYLSGSQFHETITLQPAQAQRITLQTRDLQDRPLGGVAISLAESHLTTDASGSAMLEIRPGIYEIVFTVGGGEHRQRLIVTKGVRTYTFRISGVVSEVELPRATLLPNPTTGRFTIRSHGAIAAVRIYTQHGALVRCVAGLGSECEVDLRGSQPGMYLVEVAYASGRREVHRLAVQ